MSTDPTSPVVKNTSSSNSQKRIFISHATQDRDLADKLVQLMEGGIGIDDSNVFCTSLEGMDIPTGKDFIGFIKGQIQNPDAVIILLTPHYYNSEFCLCELGASWAMSKQIFPFILLPLEFKDIKGVLSVTQCLKIGEPKDLSKFQHEISTLLGVVAKPVAVWEKRRTEFLDWLVGFIKDYKLPERISPEEYRTLKKKYDDTAAATIELDDKLSALKKLYEKVKAFKDIREVSETELSELPEADKFNKLVDNAKKQMSALPPVVRRAFFELTKNRPFPLPELGYSNYNDEFRGMHEAVSEGYLEDSRGEIMLNKQDDTVADVLEAISKLESFIKFEVSSEFASAYRAENKFPLELGNKRCWENLLG